jgi:hypothetical protein
MKLSQENAPARHLKARVTRAPSDRTGIGWVLHEKREAAPKPPPPFLAAHQSRRVAELPHGGQVDHGLPQNPVGGLVMVKAVGPLFQFGLNP